MKWHRFQVQGFLLLCLPMPCISKNCQWSKLIYIFLFTSLLLLLTLYDIRQLLHAQNICVCVKLIFYGHIRTAVCVLLSVLGIFISCGEHHTYAVWWIIHIFYVL